MDGDFKNGIGQGFRVLDCEHVAPSRIGEEGGGAHCGGDAEGDEDVGIDVGVPPGRSCGFGTALERREPLGLRFAQFAVRLRLLDSQ